MRQSIHVRRKVAGILTAFFLAGMPFTVCSPTVRAENEPNIDMQSDGTVEETTELLEDFLGAEGGSALRIGTLEDWGYDSLPAGTERYAHARVPISPLSDSFILSLDYLPGQTGGGGFSMFRLKTNSGSSDYIPQLEQRGTTLRIKDPTGTKDIANFFAENEWVHLDVVVQGGEARYYVDGQILQVNGADYVYQISAETKPDTFGTLGDEVAGWYNYYSWFDNIVLIENGEVTWDSGFDGATLDSLRGAGWTLACSSQKTLEESFAVDPLQDCPAQTITELDAALKSSEISLTAGETVPLNDLIAISCMASGGWEIASDLLNISIRSENNEVAEVSEDGTELILKSAGSCDLTVTADYLSDEKTDTVNLQIQQAKVLTGYVISNTEQSVPKNGRLQLNFSKVYEDESLTPVETASIQDLNVISLADAVISVSQEAGEWYLNGLSDGVAEIQYSYTFDGDPVSKSVEFRVGGGSLQTGDGTRNVGGQAMRVLADNGEAITADEYIISFDYRYPSTSEMYNYYTWYSFDVGGAATGSAQYVPPAILQIGQTLQLYCWLNAPVTVTETLEPDVWHNIAFHFQDNYDGQGGRRLGLYLDGEPLALNNNEFWFEKKENIKYPTLGWFGDTTNNDTSYGDAWYDNIRVYQKNETGWDVTTDQNFNDTSATLASLGWQASGPNIGIVSDIPDAQVGELESLTLTGRTGFQVGATVPVSEAVSVSRMMTTGHGAILALGNITYTSSAPEIMEIVETEGVQNLHFLKEGICTLEASCELFGVVRKAELEIIVSNEALMSGVSVVLDRNELAVGETIEQPLLRVIDTMGISEIIRTLPEGVEAQSSNSDVLQVETGADRTLTLTAKKAGTASVQLTFSVLGEPKTFETPVTIYDIVSLEAQLARTPIYVTDRNDILLTAKLSNGRILDDLPFEMSYQFSDPAAMKCITEGEDAGRLLALAPCRNLTITVSATLGGNPYQTTVDTEISSLVISKTKSTLYTAEEVANARVNVEKYEWAKREKDAAVKAADEFLSNFTYEDMWYSWSPQGVPRTYSVNEKAGCPICGSAIYNYSIYPWKIDSTKMNWKIYCPNCGIGAENGDEGISFPTNDFLSYYKGGIDQYGEFDAELAKQHNDQLIAGGGTGNLVNRYYGKALSEEQLAKLREKGISEEVITRITADPNFGVDDGFGYIDENTGTKYALAALYAETYSWRSGPGIEGLLDLRDAYLYTGEQKYADAAIIMLDRIADVYPALDLREWRAQDGYVNGIDNNGKATNGVWECLNINKIMPVFDAVYPAIATMSDQAKHFLAAHSSTQDKTNPDRIIKNIEDGILRQIVPAWNLGQIHGNEGMHQAAVTYAAVILDSYPETQDWIYRVFRTGGKYDSGNFYQLLVDEVDHDGQGYESPFYNEGWLANWLEVANALSGYELPEGQPLKDNLESDPYENVKFRKMFYGLYPMILNDIYIANIGDTVASGSPAQDFFDRTQFMQAFEKYRDPELAQVLYMLNGNSTAGLHGDIFSADPEAVIQEIEAIIQEYGPMQLPSTMLTGTGYAVLRDGISGGQKAADSYVLSFLDMEILPETTCDTAVYAPSLQLQATGIGDELQVGFDFTGDTSKTYQLSITKWTANWFGSYDIYLNGTLVKSDASFSGTGEIEELLGLYTLKPEGNVLRFVCKKVGPDPTSVSYKMAVRYLNIAEYKEGEETETQKNTQRELWVTFGKDDQHDHMDGLNLGLVAYQLDLLPDLGYPVRMDGSDEVNHWVSGTLSHNTVLVNGKQQVPAYVGTPIHFDDSDYVKLFDIDASRNYEWTDQYRRTSAMIQIDEENSYIVDLFRVSGGTKHEFSFHAAEGAVTVDGLSLTEQASGTYAGVNTTWGEMPSGDISTRNPGYYWLKNVSTDSAPGDQFSVDWNVLDNYNVYGQGRRAQTDVHVKLTMLGDYDSVSMADGIPPQKSLDSPESYRYVIVKNEGAEEQNSIFTSVIEAYRGTSNIASIELLPVFNPDNSPASDSEVRAIRVTLTNGRVDTIVNALDNTKTYLVDGISFCGFMGVRSVLNGEVVASYIADGTSFGGVESVPAVTGTVVDFTKELAVKNEIVANFDTEVDPTSLEGRYVYIDNDQKRNAVYHIEGAESLSNGNIRLDIGDVTTVRSWTDANDFSQGYQYDLAVGQTLKIPLSALQTNLPEEETYLLSVASVSGGAILAPVSGKYQAGAKITVTAQADAGYSFEGWSASGGSFEDASALQTVFTMPEKNVTITANFKKEESYIPSVPEEPGDDTPVLPGSDTVIIQYPSNDGQGIWMQFDDGHWEFSVSSGTVTGWMKIDSIWYLFNEKGIMLTGWQFVNGVWYYLLDWGGMATGWQFINNVWYYFADWGGMTTGWQLVNGIWYYMTDWGGMAVGWQYVNGHWYYLRSWGGMISSSWIYHLDGKWYYLGADGAMLVNTITPDGYYVDLHGAWIM